MEIYNFSNTTQEIQLLVMPVEDLLLTWMFPVMLSQDPNNNS